MKITKEVGKIKREEQRKSNVREKVLYLWRFWAHCP